MPIGFPDFGQNPSTNPTAPSYDAGEDTTRLLMGGGAFSRAGRWVYATGFEDSLNSIYTWGTDTSLSQDVAFQGNYSLKLAPANTLDAWTGFTRYFVLPGSRYGVECMFSKGNTGNLPSEFYLQILTQGRGNANNQRFLATLVLVNTNTPSNILYWDVNGTRTQIADVTNYINSLPTPYLFHNIKLVFDLSKNKGVRVFFDDLIFDISYLSGYATSPFYSPLITTTISLKNKQAGNSPFFYIDNFIITTDEP